MTEGFGSAGHDRQGESVYRGGFLQAWISGHFRKLEDGKLLFYPQGAFGRRGYAIASTEQELILRTNVRGFQRVYTGLLMVLILFFSGYLSGQPSWMTFLLVIGCGPVSWLSTKAYFWSLTRSMESVDVPNSPIACWRSMGTAVNPTLLIGQTIFISAISGATLRRAYQRQNLVWLLLGMILVTALVPYVIALWSWRRTWVSAKR